ncbi:hypothetical protein D3C86_961620 [compost metagenome]
MQEADLVLREDFGLEALGFLGGGPQGLLAFFRIALLDQGEDDVGLAPLLQLVADQLVGVFAALALHPGGLDGLAARRKLVDHRDVEIPVHGKRQGAGDRGGRHGQDLGVQAFGAQQGALPHAEAVLLVDHDEAQALELDAFLDQGVSTHHNRGVAGLQGLQVLASLALALPPQEQGTGDAHRFEPFLELAEVLFGEDLGGGHEGALVAVLDGDQQGQEGDHGLTGADVPLHQTVHGFGGGQVAAHLVEDPFLRAGQLEGQLLHELANQLAVGG